MLDFTDFKTALVAGCRSMLDAIPEDSILKNIELEERSVTKAQRGELSALLFRAPGTACAPTFYVEDYYGMYRDGHPLEELYVRLVQDGIHYVTNPPSIAGIDPEALAEREGFGVRLLNKAKNHDYLKDVPHIDDIGLALIAEMRSGEFRAVITNSLMEEMGLTKEELFEKALRESAEKDRATLYRISDMLCSPESCENLLESGADAINESDPLLVLSNEDCFWGAAALFYPGMLARLSDLLGGNFYVLPSSVHEVLLLPVSEGDPQSLASTIREANRSVTDCSVFLADDLFVCVSGKLKQVSFGGVIPSRGNIPC
ncbi:MAG: hypothetical protein E7227_06400 [Clostridiales bacterium]|nr:hypothetical protein [Clostridiales bacterium]